MALLGALGLATAGIGAISSIFGASKAAKAMKKAVKNNTKDENAFYERQSGLLEDLMDEKKEKLYDIGNIFDRFESTGAFGDTDTLKNLRTAQSDFSKLAAGDFSGFEAQLRKSMSDALITTVGSGSPVGSYSQLAADTQMSYRKEGISTSMGISDYLSNESFKMLGQEFGIMDKGFEVSYQLDRTKTSNIANYRMQKASQEGVGLTAFGNAAMQIGGTMTSLDRFNTSSAIQAAAYGVTKGIAGAYTKNPSTKTYSNSTPTYNTPILPTNAAANSDAGPLPAEPTMWDTFSDWWSGRNYMPAGSTKYGNMVDPFSDSVGVLPPRSQAQYAPSYQQNPIAAAPYSNNGSYSSVLASIGASIVS